MSCRSLSVQVHSVAFKDLALIKLWLPWIKIPQPGRLSISSECIPAKISVLAFSNLNPMK